MSELEFLAPLPLRDCQQNTRKHWRYASKAVKQYRQEVELAAAEAVRTSGWNPPDRVEVSLLFAIKGARGTGRYQPQDELNALGAFKAGLDGMVDGGVVKDDSRKHVTIAGCRITSTEGPFVRVSLRVLA